MNQTEADRYRARSRQAFDAQAATFDVGTEGSHARMLYPHVVEAVTASVAGIEGPRLLDLGCGTGALAERVIESAPDARLSCVDLSPNMVEAARARLAGRARVAVCDAERLIFPDSSSMLRGATTPSTTTRTPNARRSRRGASSPRAAASSSAMPGSPVPHGPS